MRRPFLVLCAAIAAIGLFAGGLAWLLDTPRPRPGASRAERIYQGLCATCHGADGRGSWRAALFLLRPGNLAEASRRDSERYLVDIVKNGGAPIGRPGMPAFGAQLSEDDVRALVGYVRRLGER
jgi:mono/diheme cytochrome c family protein